MLHYWELSVSKTGWTKKQIPCNLHITEVCLPVVPLPNIKKIRNLNTTLRCVSNSIDTPIELLELKATGLGTVFLESNTTSKLHLPTEQNK